MPPTEEDIAWFKSTFHPIPKPRLPDDCVEYSLYLISPNLDSTNDSEVRLRLREVQKHASELTKKLLKDYIWQRDGFGLELVREDGLSLLRGRTEYGDSVEDEWVVVYLLRELTKKFEDLWVKVGDSDGEFLLVEAAGTLPAWLEPEVADNRVWIHNGGLTIIKPQHDTRGSKKVTEKLSLLDARKIALNEPRRLLHSASIEEEAFYRLRNYPKQINENMHHALVTIPRQIAYLLHQKPAYISPAVESFYLRDPIALRPLQAKQAGKLVFKPEDFVTTSVRFTRVGYAQLKSQDFPVPKTWLSAMPPESNAKERAMAELGMKLSCGFEMFVSDSQNQDKPTVREIKLLLEDLESGDDHLPTDQDIAQWEQKEDDEKWLEISFEDLEGELAGKSNKKSSKPGEFGDKAAQENLQRIVSQFEKFLNDDSAGAEGADFIDELDSDDDLEGDDSEDEVSSEGEDKEASFDEDQFAAMMREMMGMPADAETRGSSKGSARPVPRPGRVEELDSDDEDAGSESGEDIQTLMKRMEDELNETGALNLDPTPRKVAATQKAVKDKGKGKATSSTATTDHEAHDEESNDEPDVDVNLVKNLLESFKSQGGMPGPGGNLMGMMGVRMPRDESQESGDK